MSYVMDNLVRKTLKQASADNILQRRRHVFYAFQTIWNRLKTGKINLVNLVNMDFAI